MIRFTLLDPTQRLFGVERMYLRSTVHGWLELAQTGPIALLAHTLIPTLVTDQFFALF